MKYLIILLAIFALPLVVQAAPEPGFLDSPLLKKCMEEGNCQLADVATGFILLIRLLLGGMGAVALLYFVVGGFQLLTSQGNQEKVRNGQRTMINTVAALTIAFTSYLLLNFFVNNILNVDQQYRITGTPSVRSNNSGGECVGKSQGTPCSTSNINYVCTGAEFENQCVTKCMLQNIVDREVLATNKLNWSCGTIANPSTWHVSGLCPGSVDNVCILFWNGTAVTNDHMPPNLGEIINTNVINF